MGFLEIRRIITHNDFDGLVSASLSSFVTGCNKFIFTGPNSVERAEISIDDRDVAVAVRFIRQHSREPIQVADIAEAAAIGRRSLEKRFRKVLGRSLHDEIRRVRVEQVAKMLVETNLSVSQIADSFGYSSVNNIARYFRREKGISLFAYRKLYGYK